VESGTANLTAGGSFLSTTISGTLAPPTLTLMLLSDSDTLNYSGTFVSSDSITGVISQDGTSLPLSLKKN
jgi:hypothetical protein